MDEGTKCHKADLTSRYTQDSTVALLVYLHVTCSILAWGWGGCSPEHLQSPPAWPPGDA
jgi:hypothetical protein